MPRRCRRTRTPPGGARRPDAGPRWAARLGTIPLLLAVLGCAPSTPTTADWRTSAAQSVAETATAVETARLSLDRSDRMSSTYLRTVLLDAEEQADSAASRLTRLQPPRAERGRSVDVRAELDQAGSLLTDARIGVVAGEEGRYDELADRLARLADRLTDLERELGEPAAADPVAP